jgi:hypothetical protein
MRRGQSMQITPRHCSTGVQFANGPRVDYNGVIIELKKGNGNGYYWEQLSCNRVPI